MQESRYSTAVVAGAATVANGSAWIQSFISENVSVGAVVTFCTIAVPAVVGAFIYTVKNAGPVLIDLRIKLDAAKSATLSGQMERLNNNLEDTKRQAQAHEVLARAAQATADTASRQADRLQEMLELAELQAHKSEQRNVDLMDQVMSLTESVRSANSKLHEIKNSANVTALANEELQREIHAVKVQLDKANNQLGANFRKTEQVADQVEKINAAGTTSSSTIMTITETTRRTPDPDCEESAEISR